MPRKNRRLGEMLIEAGLVDEFQLNSALSYQRNWGGRLGACLIRLGYVAEENLLSFLADQLKLARVDLKGRTIPEEVLAYVSAEKALECNVIPVSREERHGTLFLLVAMSDPTNLYLIDELQFMTGCRVRPALASEAAIREAIVHRYTFAAPPEPEPEESAVVEVSTGSYVALPVPVSRPAVSTEEKFQQLLKILMEKGILSLRDYDRLK